MSKAHARLYAVHFCSVGAEKLVAGMLLQREIGLRPSEHLGFLRTDVALPERRDGAHQEFRQPVGRDRA